MAPFSVVEDLDVFKQVAVGILVIEPTAVVGELGLEQMEKRLGHGIIPAVSLAAHALHKAMAGHPAGEVTAGILDAAIGVDDQPRRSVRRRRTFRPARSPVATRPCTDAAEIRASRGSCSRRS